MGYYYLRKLMGVESVILVGCKVGKALSVVEKEVGWIDGEGLDVLLLLFAIPRFLITAQGVDNAAMLYEMQPLKPCFTLKVEIYRRPGAERSEELDEAVLTLIALTPMVAGLGKSVPEASAASP